jgi:hypothetical protein
MSFRFLGNTAASLQVLLDNNDDSVGFSFACDNSGNGTLAVAGDPADPNGAGSFPRTYTCDGAGDAALTAELDGRGNRTSTATPNVSLSGSNDFTAVDPTVGFP